MLLPIAFLGDVVGSPGREAVAHAARSLRARHPGLVLIVNGENSRNGSGLSPDNYRDLRKSHERGGGGVNAVTLGDHVYKDRAIIPLLEDHGEPIARPANLAPDAPGKRAARVIYSNGTADSVPPLYLMTVLGRLFMPMPADNPFAAVDREIAAIVEPDAMVIVEVHAEATSEKQAMAWHCLERWSAGKDASGGPAPRVIAVVGTHTHVQTADARIIDHAVAAVTDLGMTGPHRSVIGRDVRATLLAMTRQQPVALDVASDDVRACGVLLTIDPAARAPVAIERLDLAVPG